MRVRREFVGVKFGAAALARFDENASSVLRALLESPDPKGGWTDFELFIEATVLVDRLFGTGDLELARDVGRFAAAHNQGIWKSFIVKRVPPSLVMRLAAGVWHHHYDAGRLSSRPLGATGIAVSVANFPRPHRAHCLSIAGWMLGTLELGPRTDISVTEVSCRAQGGLTCEWHGTWKG